MSKEGFVMGDPEGSLTPAQFEILQMLWDSAEGMSAAEIWERIRAEREVSRTTVSNLVDRLEKRNWLLRRKVDGVFRYAAAIEREATEGKLAAEFAGDFFNGSASNMLLSLLGTNRISRDELKRLKSILDDSKSPKNQSPKK